MRPGASAPTSSSDPPDAAIDTFCDIPPFMPPPSETTPPTPQQAFVSIGAICLVAWKIAVDGHIWRHALGWPVVGGVLLALGLFLFELGIEQMVFPVPT